MYLLVDRIYPSTGLQASTGQATSVVGVAAALVLALIIGSALSPPLATAHRKGQCDMCTQGRDTSSSSPAPPAADGDDDVHHEVPQEQPQEAEEVKPEPPAPATTPSKYVAM